MFCSTSFLVDCIVYIRFCMSLLYICNFVVYIKKENLILHPRNYVLYNVPYMGAWEQ